MVMRDAKASETPEIRDYIFHIVRAIIVFGSRTSYLDTGSRKRWDYAEDGSWPPFSGDGSLETLSGGQTPSSPGGQISTCPHSRKVGAWALKIVKPDAGSAMSLFEVQCET